MAITYLVKNLAIIAMHVWPSGIHLRLHEEHARSSLDCGGWRRLCDRYLRVVRNRPSRGARDGQASRTLGHRKHNLQRVYGMGDTLYRAARFQAWHALGVRADPDSSLAGICNRRHRNGRLDLDPHA
jgi:hypothetical protein